MRQDENLTEKQRRQRAYQRGYYANHAEQMRERSRVYYQTHKEDQLQYKRSTRGRVIQSASNRRYYERHKERLLMISRIVYQIQKHTTGGTYHDARVLAIRIYETVTKNFPTE